MYKSVPLSRKTIREYALKIREIFGISDNPIFPVIKTLDYLPELIDGFSYEIIEDQLMQKENLAYYNLNKNKIFIKESVYEGACNGDVRDRFTIVHEIAHAIFFMGDYVLLRRDIGDKKKYEDPEWQANTLAAELLVPWNLLDPNMSAQQVSNQFKVSLKVAKIQLEKYQSN